VADEITIRTYRSDDLPALVALINEADAVDKWEEATTIEQMEHEMSFPNVHPETDCFLAWDGDQLVGYADFFARLGDPERGEESTIDCWGVVHPRWRRRGLGRRLLEMTYQRAEEMLPSIKGGWVNVQCSPRDSDEGRRALCESFGMEPVRYFVNLVRPLNRALPSVEPPAGIRLRTFDPEQDIEAVWRVGNAAFRDHWGYAESKLEEFVHWAKMPHIRSELWFLAEEKMSGEIVGLGLNIVDPDWIAQTGRREGYVDTLAVLREHRKKGLGTALLAQSLHALSQAGMEAVHLHADADNLTGAMRLYEGMGFRIRKTSVAYRKVLGVK
jgi:mycothiol synthase